MDEEADFLAKAKQSTLSSKQAMLNKRTKDSDDLMEKYSHFIEYLKKIDADEYCWVHNPIMRFTKVKLGNQCNKKSCYRQEYE